MLKEIYGKKLGMSQLFDENGDLLPVTLVEIEPVCILEEVTYPKHRKVKIGCFKIEGKKISKLSKAVQGYFNKLGLGNYAVIREVNVEKDADLSFSQGTKEQVSQPDKLALENNSETKPQENEGIKPVDESDKDKKESGNPREIGVGIFSEGDIVDVRSKTKGRGFTGGMKRHHWRGQPKSHGSTTHRRVGSVGASAYPSRIIKGLRMPGHMGNAFKTAKKLKVLKIDNEKNILFIRGCVPGPVKSIVRIKKVS